MVHSHVGVALLILNTAVMLAACALLLLARRTLARTRLYLEAMRQILPHNTDFGG
jgi:hypothetical protein